MELLAPVGNLSMLRAAVDSGCNAVYFGIKGLNMRDRANNFAIEEIKKVVDFCHKNNVKAYCCVNVIIYENELNKLDEVLKALKEAGIDAVICWDMAVVKKCNELCIDIHLSTQASVSNSEAAKLWKIFGVKRIILARECKLEDIKEIKEKIDVEVEVFVHGARCISLSGRCFMSEELFDKSANRGECLQPCRREFKVVDEEEKQMKMNNNFIMSAKDLCALPLLDKIIGLGVDSIKIEGRNRRADYVSKVVSVYRKAIDAIKSKKFTKELIDSLMEELKSIYNKDFSSGYFVDYPHHERCDVYGSKSTMEKMQLGKVDNFYNEKMVAELKIESYGFKKGDKLGFLGNKTGYHEQVIEELKDYDENDIEETEKGKVVTVKLDKKVRKNDEVYLIKKR